MKPSKRRRRISSLFVMLLVSVMGVASACSSVFNLPKGASGGSSSKEQSFVKEHSTNTADPTKYIDEQYLMEETTGLASLKADDKINLIVEMNEESLFTIYEQKYAKSMTYQEFATTREGRITSENMYKKQRDMFKQISKKVDAEFRFSYTGLINGFSIAIKYGDRELADQIGYRNGMINSIISEVYADPSEAIIVENSIDVEETGIFSTDGINYDGSGMLVAVLDSGLDWTHPVFDVSNLPTAEELKQANKELKLTKSKLETILQNGLAGTTPLLSAYSYSGHITASELYVNDKVPYAYDYADRDPEVNVTEDNAHGTHVSGIILGQTTPDEIIKVDGADYLKDHTGKQEDGIRRDVYGKKMIPIKGVAPKAQIVSMKVFSDFKGGAETDSMLGALQDCALLGVDVINMSLGLGSGFSIQDDDKFIQDAYDNLGKIGVSLVVAAGNGYSSGRGGHYGTNLTSNPDSGTVGSPSTLYSSFSVASIDGVPRKYIFGKENNTNRELGVAYYTDAGKSNGDKYNFIEDLIAAVKGNNNQGRDYTAECYKDGVYKIPFVPISGLGYDGDFVGESLLGKIALIPRGVLMFTEKLENAKKAGALAAIVYNNVAGIISMSIDETVNFPACSITMDAAVPFKNVRNGYFQISSDQEAGPFMSDFSSWGPVPSLELKPEITGHGGEIYSAYPGNNYDRISGTSMAAPNIAGLVTLGRQYLSENVGKFGLNVGDTVANNNELENRVYQLMMSTATIPHNEEDKPYSPRKIGAGVANIKNMVNTNAYIYVGEYDNQGKLTGKKDRTKLELFDDPQKTGIYTMSFFVSNVGSTTLNFRPDALVMTETVSTDGITVAEKATMLDNAAKAWSASGTAASFTYYDGQKIIVPAHEDVEVTLTITLTKNETDYIKNNFANGMYVEGFAQLFSMNADGIDLSVPYLAFYGDWSDAPMFDYSIFETDPDDKDDNILEANKRYAQGRSTMVFGKLTQNNSDYTYPLGQYIFNVPTEYEKIVPAASTDRVALSMSSQSVYEIYYVSGFLRPAKKVDYRVYDKTTGRTIWEGTKVSCRKDGLYSNLGGMKLELDPRVMGCNSTSTYTFELTGYLDYYRDGKQLTTKPVKDKDGNVAKYTNSWSFDFTVNTTAPIIEDAEIRYERNTDYTYEKYLDIYVRSDHMLSAMSFNLYNKKTSEYETIFDKGLRPLLGSANSTTKITYRLTNYWDYLKENDYLIQTEIFDYAYNNSYYELDLSKLITKADSIDLADIGMYETYQANVGMSTLTVLDSYVDEIKYNDDGTYNSMPGLINILKNQQVELKYALVATPGVWLEDIEWTSSNENIISVNKRTGEIFAKNTGSATVTVSSKANSAIKRTLIIVVVPESTMETYGISDYKTNHLSPTGIRFNNEALNNTNQYWRYTLNAGEKIEDITFELLPWYSDAYDQIESVSWNSLNKSMVSAQTTGSGANLVSTITASRGTYDQNGDYTLNQYGETRIYLEIVIRGRTLRKDIYLYIRPEFVVENGVLKEYHGDNYVSDKEKAAPNYNSTIIERGTLIIPQNMKIKEIDRNVFTNNKHITKVVIPEGVTKVGYGAFCYMTALREIYFPSTIKYIDDWAVGAYNHTYTGTTTSLQVVDFSKFTEPVYVGLAAFQNQKALGTNGIYENDSIKTDPANGNASLRFVDTPLFDLSKIRTIGRNAFSSLRSVRSINVSGVRGMGTAAFVYFGDLANQNSLAVTVDFVNPDDPDGNLGCTVLGQLAFAASGINRALVLPMQRIPYEAFLQSRSIPSVTFTHNDLIIDSQAFYVCDAITSVTFEGSVEMIGESAFRAPQSTSGSFITSLTTIRWNNVRYISDSAFYGNTKLCSTSQLNGKLTLPLGLEYIDADAFTNCLAITSIELPQGFNSDFSILGAFLDQRVDSSGNKVKTSNLKSVSVVGENPKYQVQNDMLMKSYTDKSGSGWELMWVPTGKITDNFAIPAAVTRIGEGAFAGNVHLTEISFESGSQIREIGSQAFAYCDYLTKVTLPASVTEIPDSAFYGCRKLATVDFAGSAIKSIGEYAFAYTAVTSIPAVPNLEKLGEAAFMGSSITSFTIPNKITKIPAALFYSCAAFKTVTIPNTVTSIDTYAFFNSGLTAVTAANVTKIEPYAFANCTSLASANFANVKEVGAYAFYCYKVDGSTAIGGDIKDISSFRNMVSAGAYAFYNQGKLHTSGTLTLANLEKIGALAFAVADGNTNAGVKAYNLPKLKEIGAYAFQNNKNLTTFNVTKDVTSIDYAPFRGSGVNAFTVSQDNEKFVTNDNDGVLFRKTPNGLELIQYPTGKNVERNSEYVIPEGTVRVADQAFYGVTSLVTVVMPTTLKSIGDMAFFQATIACYTFTSYEAPQLESYFDMYSFSNSSIYVSENGPSINDMYDYYWGVHANFSYYFNPTGIEIYYYTSNGVFHHLESDIYIYNNITQKYYTDLFPMINKSTEGDGLTNTDYGLIMVRPSNGVGYDSFVYTNYFTSKFLAVEAMEPKTQAVINIINSLPAADSIRASHRAIIENARAEYNRLRLGQQALVSNYDKLVAVENRIEEVDPRPVACVVLWYVDGSLAGSQAIGYNQYAQRPDDPGDSQTKELYRTFEGWYVNADGTGNAFDFTVSITSNVTLYAVFKHNGTKFTVTFAECDLSPVEINGGATLVRPEDPKKSGYQFVGWKLGDKDFDFSDAVTSDITLTAVWEKTSCGCGTTFIPAAGFGAGTLGCILALAALLLAAVAGLFKKRAKGVR